MELGVSKYANLLTEFIRIKESRLFKTSVYWREYLRLQPDICI